MKNSEKTDIRWRNMTIMEKLLLCGGIRKNNFCCIGRFIVYSFILCALLAFGAFFIDMIVTEIIGGIYLLSIIVYGFALDMKCWKVLWGKVKCADAACFGRDEEYQYTVNGFSYYINVFRLCINNDKKVFNLPAYKNTLMYSNSGDNMLVVHFSKNDIRCFSKKELGLTTHSPKSGSWSRLSKEEIRYVLKAEKENLKGARITFGVDFSVMAIISIFMLINYFSLFPYAVSVMAVIIMIDSFRMRKYTSRVNKLKRGKVNALKNAIVSCFMIRKPSGRGGYNYVYYFKIMHPESGKFRIEKLRRFTWATSFDNEISDNIIVVDYGRKRKARNMQHYILEEY